MKFLFLIVLFAAAVVNSYKALEYAPNFGYDVDDKESYTDFDHSEKADGKVTTGSYRVTLPDGRTQIVTYKADNYGYNADVKCGGKAQHPEYEETQYKAPAYNAPAFSAPEYRVPAYTAPEYKAPTYTSQPYPKY